MKKHAFEALFLSIILLAVVAAGATQFTKMLNLQVVGKSMLGTTTEANSITRSLSASSTIDFASSASVCTDSSGITLTGALAGDTCDVGMPASPAANSTFTCYVSAADTVKVRHCANGATVDPASATYYVRVTSAQ